MSQILELNPTNAIAVAPTRASEGRTATLLRGLLILKFAAMLGMLLLIAAYASVLVPSLLGQQVLVVYGASMEPTIPLGSVVVLERVAPRDLRPGDVITFTRAASPGVQITHRVVSIDRSDQGVSLKTKGDANASPDDWIVNGDQTVGRVQYFVPLLGRLMVAAASSSVKAIIVALLLGTLAMRGIGALRAGNTRRD